MRDFARSAIVGFLALILVIQFLRPTRSNPPVIAARTLEAAVSVPPAVEEILTRSCNDCHSNLTQWPWYTNVAPVSWFIAHHVDEGRRHLNFSEWLNPNVLDPVQYTRQKFESACRQMRTGDMPLTSYLWIHRDARPSPEAVQTLCSWADSGITARQASDPR